MVAKIKKKITKRCLIFAIFLFWLEAGKTEPPRGEGRGEGQISYAPSLATAEDKVYEEKGGDGKESKTWQASDDIWHFEFSKQN